MLVNIRQEMSFLGCLLMTPRLVDNAIIAGVNTETFTLPFYQELWDWIERNHRDGMGVTDEDALNHFVGGGTLVVASGGVKAGDFTWNGASGAAWSNPGSWLVDRCTDGAGARRRRQRGDSGRC